MKTILLIASVGLSATSLFAQAEEDYPEIFCSHYTQATPDKTTVAAPRGYPTIVKLSRRLSQHIKRGSIDSIMHSYADDIIYHAQYKPSINTKRTLADFYRQWLDSVSIISYERKIVDLELVENRAFETGVFFIEYLFDTVPGKYGGKYMLVWRGEDETYRIEAESFCSDYFLPNDSVPYRSVPVAFVAPSYRLNEGDDPENEIRELNEELTRNVASGNGRGRAEGYHRNAIYMPNFSKMLVGIDSIRPYLHDTYYPGSNLYADHTFFDVRPINDDNVLIIGHFKGGWERPNDQGVFEGNMINWRKRRKDGKLVMYRQIVNSDR